MHVESCHSIRQTLHAGFTRRGHGQTSWKVLVRAMALSAAVGVEHVMSLVSSVGRSVVLAAIGSHCRGGPGDADCVKDGGLTDGRMPETPILAGSKADGKKAGPNVTVETLKKGRAVEAIEMQRRTLLCGREVSFYPHSAKQQPTSPSLWSVVVSVRTRMRTDWGEKCRSREGHSPQ